MSCPGDWIQVTLYEVTTECPEGVVVERHGGVNSIAHVLETYPDGWVNAYFEKTESVSLVAPENFKVIASPATGL